MAMTRTLSAEYNFSRTHGYFFCMGGFVSSMGYPVATKEQVDDPDLGPEFLKHQGEGYRGQEQR
jgi:hypothetical protein